MRCLGLVAILKLSYQGSIYCYLVLCGTEHFFAAFAKVDIDEEAPVSFFVWKTFFALLVLS